MSSQSLAIRKGETFKQIVRWETDPKVYQTITAATAAAPCRLTIPSHGIPDGWRLTRIAGCGGMKQLNTHTLQGGRWSRTAMGAAYPDGIKVTVVDPNTLELNSINSSVFTAYTSGGNVEYNSPVNLTGFTARMQIRDSVAASAFLLEFTTENGRIALDNTAKTITITLTASDTAALTFSTGVTSLEMVAPTGEVTILVANQAVIVAETDITRP